MTYEFLSFYILMEIQCFVMKKNELKEIFQKKFRITFRFYRQRVAIQNAVRLTIPWDLEIVRLLRGTSKKLPLFIFIVKCSYCVFTVRKRKDDNMMT